MKAKINNYKNNPELNTKKKQEFDKIIEDIKNSQQLDRHWAHFDLDMFYAHSADIQGYDI